MVPAAVCASFAFMLPIAGPSNAIVFSTGRITIFDMVWFMIFKKEGKNKDWRSLGELLLEFFETCHSINFTVLAQRIGTADQVVSQIRMN